MHTMWMLRSTAPFFFLAVMFTFNLLAYVPLAKLTWWEFEDAGA